MIPRVHRISPAWAELPRRRLSDSCGRNRVSGSRTRCGRVPSVRIEAVGEDVIDVFESPEVDLAANCARAPRVNRQTYGGQACPRQSGRSSAGGSRRWRRNVDRQRSGCRRCGRWRPVDAGSRCARTRHWSYRAKSSVISITDRIAHMSGCRLRSVRPLLLVVLVLSEIVLFVM